jgi:hypothetical protein
MSNQVSGGLLNAQQYTVTMQGAQRHGFQDQQVKRAGQ